MYEQSLFQRLQLARNQVHMLTTQYRMHPEIRKFPSDHFYQYSDSHTLFNFIRNRLVDGENVSSYDQPYYKDNWGPYRFFHVAGTESKSQVC
jgi:senataxin